MLTDPKPQRRRRSRRQQSLRQEYEEFILQRIEEFKDRLTRDELLVVADEAVRELEVEAEEQLILTEVLVLEHVDRLIMRRLNLPSFRRWRDKHVRLRRAQREPTHWGLDRDCPLTDLVRALPEEWSALVVGARARTAAFYLAACEWPVLFIDQDLGSVETAETQAAAEALAHRFQALVVNLRGWFPDVQPGLAVLDSASLGRLEAGDRVQLLESLQRRTPLGGVHCLLAPNPVEGITSLTIDILKSSYRGWRLEKSLGSHGHWYVATKQG